MAQHKWHKEIKAWADGAEIEYRKKNGYGNLAGEWQTIEDVDNSGIDWSLDNFEYRIKPQPKEPLYMYVLREHGNSDFWISPFPASAKNVKTIGKIKLEPNDD